MAHLLQTEHLSKRFCGITAVNQLSLAVDKGEIRGIIGPNGSGKTTLINLLSGLHKPSTGKIYLNGRQIEQLRPDRRTGQGIIRTFQIPRVFRNMTVLENMLLPALADSQGDRWKQRQQIVSEAEELLDFVLLRHLKNQPAGNLSGGQNMLLQIARGFMIKPLLLYLMDEPFAGVNPQIKSIIMAAIKEMNREKGITFLIVSHEMSSIRQLCDKVSVMHEGSGLAEGSLEEVARIPAVIEAYIS